MSECVFCDIATHRTTADIIFENESAVCFLPRKMETYGHCLVIPKIHYENILDVNPVVLGKLMTFVQETARHLKEVLGADGINLLHASGKAAGQSVPHLHFHLLPRFYEDGLNAWPQLPEVFIDRSALLEKLRLQV